MSTKNIYDNQSVKNLFDEMSSTYGLMNIITSFGFTYFWRKACIQEVSIKPDDRVYDLMTGMGELFGHISDFLGTHGELRAVDFSKEMCKVARSHAADSLNVKINVLEEDVLNFEFENGSANIVVSSFGLKTFSDKQLQQLAVVTFNLLKAGGCFSYVEISVPKNKIFKFIYMLYLKKVIPLLGRIFLGNPENYRQLGVYTEKFGSSEKALKYFQAAGLKTEVKSLFFGCATILKGQKPN